MKQSNLHLYMTGFGPFRTITVNPSAEIGEAVSKQLMENPNTQVNYEELEVNLDATSAYFNRLQNEIERLMVNDSDERVLLVHIGVHSKEEAGRMRIEVRGYNELEERPIDESLPMDVYDESLFVSNEATAVVSLVEQLNTAISTANYSDEERQRPHWLISYDAGRYYCNYTLYKSLQIQKQWNGRVFAVFLHVANPLIHNNPSLEEQTAQVHKVVARLVQIVSEDNTIS